MSSKTLVTKIEHPAPDIWLMRMTSAVTSANPAERDALPGPQPQREARCAGSEQPIQGEQDAAVMSVVRRT